MYEIEVQDEFQAAHALKLYDGSWEPKHGHMWKVAVRMRADKLDSIGVVADFELLKPCLKKTLSEFDHTDFNHHPDFAADKLNPSTENIAKTIYDRLSKNFKSGEARITKVTVWETPDACASFHA